MKLLVLLLVTASVALAPATLLEPGNGDAAAAVAARNKDLPAGQQNAQEGTALVFALSGGGSILHSHDNQPGDKPFKSKVKADDVVDCIAGNAQGCSELTVETDKAGQAFLYWDSPTNWRIATNPSGTDTTSLIGTVDGKGGFAFSGTHALSGTSFYLTGKVKLDKTQAPDFVPLKISGKILAVCTGQGHYGSGNFKAVPAVP